MEKQKYLIVPASWDPFEKIEAGSKEDALIAFAGKMDTDMGAYFRAVTEEEYDRITKEHRRKEHEKFVTAWMKQTILEEFWEIREEDADGCAELSYEVYCRGDGYTEYESIERAGEEWIRGKMEQMIRDKHKEIPSSEAYSCAEHAYMMFCRCGGAVTEKEAVERAVNNL